MTLILKLDLDIVKMYLHTKNEVSMWRGSKVIAWTDRNTDRQTDRQKDSQTDTDTHTHRHDWKHYLPIYAGGNYTKKPSQNGRSTDLIISWKLGVFSKEAVFVILIKGGFVAFRYMYVSNFFHILFKTTWFISYTPFLIFTKNACHAFPKFINTFECIHSNHAETTNTKIYRKPQALSFYLIILKDKERK